MKKKLVIAILLSMILISIGYFLINDNSSQHPPSKISEEPLQDKREPNTEIKEAFITLYSNDGGTKWQLGADSIQQFESGSQVILNEVQTKVYQGEKEVISLTAARGEFDAKTGFLAFEGPIIIENEDKLVKADRLNWNQVKNELVGLGNVLIQQSNVKIRGDRFISQVDLKRLRVLGNVKVISQKVGEKNE